MELRILRILWESGPATLGKVHAELSRPARGGRRGVAKTTVATMLGVMLNKKLVRRRNAAEGYLWTAAVDRRGAAKGIVAKLLDYIFEGSASRMVNHLVEEGKISRRELAEIARRRKEQSKRRKRTTK